MEISKPYKGKGKRKLKKMPFTVKDIFFIMLFLGINNFYLFSLRLNLMQLPVVNHPDYVAKINDDNKFPIKKFGALAEHLLKTRRL